VLHLLIICHDDSFVPSETLVAAILGAVVSAVDVPVTLKIRTGWAPDQRNAVAIAGIAERAGIAALAVHGRTRACGFVGPAEYDTIRAVKAAVSSPVMANGDIATPADARSVLEHTGADALMIGRAAQGRPWIFREIRHFLDVGVELAPPTVAEARALILDHLDDHYALYGAEVGVRVARKHLGWYTRDLFGGEALRREANTAQTTDEQVAAVIRFFDTLAERGERLDYRPATARVVDARASFGPRHESLRGGEALAA
jgi:tRNA-dihydrouridine synthase B